MAQGVPVIASAIAGLNEIVTPECGWTFPVGDAAALAAVIQGVHPDEKRDAAQARAKIFSIEKMAQQTEAFYASILD
jgi:glycosyltransferase involved in cell wall biosynthesis